MAEADLTRDTLANFASALISGHEISDVLHILGERVTAILGLAGAGVSLVEGTRVRFVVATQELVAGIEQLQDKYQRGPCVKAMQSRHVVAISDLRDGRRSDEWPEYVAEAISAGIVAVAGIPLLQNGHPIGVLNLYDSKVRLWQADDFIVPRILADMATSYVGYASELARQQRTNKQLEHALSTRIVIEQAKGIIAAQRAIGVNSAFALLRQHARNHNADIHEVAKAVVELDMKI